MTSGNDKKGPPPRRPAPPPGAPSRPAGPTTGGSAARPAPRPAAPALAPARGPAPAPRPAPRAPVMEADADEKTSAINLADMGLDESEATVSVSSEAIKARAAARAPAPNYDADEKTTAFNLADLPPEDNAHDAKRPPQKTLLGHPAPKATGGAAVRGGAAPARRAETQAISPSMGRPAPKAPAPHYDDEKTSALSLDDIDKIDAAPARPAAKFSPPPQEEKTAAMSLDDIDKIDMRPTPQRGQKGAPTHLGQDEKTMAVSLDDIDKIDAAPRRAAARVQEAAQDEKTTAMSLDDIDKIDAGGPVFSKRAEAPKAQAPQRARAAGAAPQTPDGFLGSIAYVFQADARRERGEAVDDAKKAAGLRNLIIVGGAAAALMLVIGLIF